MTWTYNQTLATTKDQVRLYIGDTDSNDPQLSDEEIAFVISVVGSNAQQVAIRSIDLLIAKYARLVSESMDGISLSHSERLNNYKTLKTSLEKDTTLSAPVPVVGGLVDAEGNDVKPFFTRDTPETNW